MKAILLAAGRGTRIQDITLGEPKSLIKVSNLSILENTLQTLNKENIFDIDIVVGHKANQIITAINQMNIQGNVRTIYSEKYAQTGTAYSLFKALEKGINDDVVLIEADVLFEQRLLNFLIQNSYEGNASLVEAYYDGLDGSFVDIDKRKYIIDWTHKDMRDPNDPINHLYKTINIHKFTCSFVEQLLFPKLKSLLPLISSSNQSLERVFREIVQENPSEIIGLDNQRKFLWHEVDDIHDLKLAKRKFDMLKVC